MQAVTITDPRQVAALHQQVAELEAYAKGSVQTALGKRLAYYTTIAAMAGPQLSTWISEGGVLENEQATEAARNVARSLRALDIKIAVIVPWQAANSSSVKFAIATRDVGELDQSLRGLWTVLAVAAGITLFLVEPGAAIAGAGIYLVDAYLGYKTVEANARETLARTQENMSNALALAQKRGDTTQANAILAAMQAASKAADDADPSWLDRILGVAKSVAAGAAGGFGAAAGIVLFLILASRARR